MNNATAINVTAKKQRNSSIEVLRIIAMLFIVISHFSVHGVGDYISLNDMTPCFNKYLLQSTQLGSLSVDIFVMISGYFCIKSKFRIEKFIKLVLQVFFYSMLFFIAFTALGITDFSVKALITSFFPAMFKKYWFFTAYLLLYALTPFINKYLNVENRKNHLALIIILLVVLRYIPLAVSTINESSSSSIAFADLLVSYLVGAYLRLYPDNFLNKKNNSVIALIICAVISVSSVGVISFASKYVSALSNHITLFYGRTSALMIIIAASALVIAGKINIGEKKFINAVSACTFGVYLIHDNQCVRPFLWDNIVHAADHVYNKTLILYIIAVAVVVFIVCTAIDFIRQKLIEKPVMAAVDIICSKIRQKAEGLYDKKSQKI